MKKVAYFVTGRSEEVAADLKRLGLDLEPASLRVIVPSGFVKELVQRDSLPPAQVFTYSPASAALLWIRLWVFLGLSPQAEVICLKSPRQFRFLKFLALTLRGRLTFSDGKGAFAAFSLGGLLWFRWIRLRQALKPKGAVCVVASASPSNLDSIIVNVRQRYPGAAVHGLLPASSGTAINGWFDSIDPVDRPWLFTYFRLLPRCIGRRRFQRIVLPWTNENYFGLKCMAWCLPLWSVEVYNENVDAFSGRSLYKLIGHALWRSRKCRECRLAERQKRRKQRELLKRRLPVGVVGSASAFHLETILPVARSRFPEASLIGLLPSPLPNGVDDRFTSVVPLEGLLPLAYVRLLPRCFGNGRFQALILPCTGENNSGLKWMAWWLPLWRVEIYNENGDAFSGRNLYLLTRHWLWSMRQQLDRSRQQRRKERARRRQTWPIGVVGSASAYYLKKILPRVRDRFPQARLHGVLPASLEGPAQDLFDSTTILPAGFGRALWRAWRASRKGGPFQCWIIPCTNEPYHRMKLFAFLLPLSPRLIFNEQADGFPVRKLGTFRRHLVWRLRDHLSFQIYAGTAGKTLSLRLLHLFLYGLRLATAAPLIWRAGLRHYFRRRNGYPGSSRGIRPGVDLIYLDPGSPEQATFQDSRVNGNGPSLRLILKRRGNGRMDEGPQELNAAIRNSRAEFICLMDSRCKMLADDWLERLLEAFDDRTAQVGPQFVNPSDGSFVRGLLLGRDEAPRWNSGNAVSWHSHSEWLAVDGLPWACVVFRRSVFQQVGFFNEGWDGDPMWLDWDFCRRLSAHGWHSICNQSVTAANPVAAAVRSPLKAVPAMGVLEDRR